METLNLEKGQRINLEKEAPGLTKVNVGLGWDVNKGNGASFDLDSFAFVLKSGKLLNGLNSVVYFRNLTVQGVKHNGDNLTGVGDGDDEVISVDFSALPADADEVVIGVNIYQADSKRQNFGMVNNAFIRISDASNNNEILKYDLSEDHSTATGMLMGKLYKKDGQWRFQATGEGVTGSIDAIANPYKS